MHKFTATAILSFLFLLACPILPPAQFAITFPKDLKLLDLSDDQQELLRATIEIEGLPGGESSLQLEKNQEGLYVASGDFVLDIQKSTKATLTIRLYGRYDSASSEVLLTRLEQPVDLEPHTNNAIKIDKSFKKKGEPVFDVNRNNKYNLEDLLADIDPAPSTAYVSVAPSSLQFFSGIRLGDFERRILLLQNFSEDEVVVTAELFDAPGVLLDRVNTSGEAQREGAKRKLEGDDFILQPLGVGMFAVTFAPMNTYLSWGVVQVTARNTHTKVTQTYQVRIIANSGGALQPQQTGYVSASATLLHGGALGGYPSDLIQSYPAAKLFSGREFAEEERESATTLTRTGETISWGDGKSMAADKAFVISIPPEHRFSATLSGLSSDVDMALFQLDDNYSIDSSAPVMLSQTLGPEAVALPKELGSDSPRAVLLVLGRRDSQEQAAQEVPYALSAHVVAGPEFDETRPIDPVIGVLEGGIGITLRGRGFKPGLRVTFSHRLCGNVEVIDETTVTCTLPPGSLDIGDNPATVVVENPAEEGEGFGEAATLPEGFTYLPPTPVIHSLQPPKGPALGGTPVTIRGAYFSNRQDGPQIYFGDNQVPPSEVTFASPSEISVLAPASTSGEGNVNVSVVNNVLGGYQATSAAMHFEYLQPQGEAPSISDFAPSSGSISENTAVTINGDNFTDGANVLFGSSNALSVRYYNSQSIVAYVPDHSLATVKITVVNPDGQFAVSQGDFSFAVPEPHIHSVYPHRVPIVTGQERRIVVVSGEHFVSSTRARAIDEEANATELTLFSRPSTKSLWLEIPNTLVQGSYAIEVSSDGGTHQYASALYLYDPRSETHYPAPAISQTVPSSGSPSFASEITVNGSNFGQLQGETREAPAVYVGAQHIPNVYVNQAGTELRFLSPVGGFEGSVLLRVVNADDQYAWIAFTFVREAELAIYSVYPASADCTGGQQVVYLGGSSFDLDSLRVGAVQVPEANILESSSSEIWFVLPAIEAVGAVLIRVLNSDGQEASSTIVCTGTLHIGDYDADGIPDRVDNCYDTSNPYQEDFDGDHIGDHCDNCIYDFNPDQVLVCTAGPLPGERGGPCLPQDTCLGTNTCIRRSDHSDPICMVTCTDACDAGDLSYCGQASREDFLAEYAELAPYPNTCNEMLQRYDECSWGLGRCDSGLECLPSHYLGTGKPTAARYHCQLPCDYQTATPDTTCGGDSCVSNNAVVFVYQEEAGNPVLCYGGTECDEVNGYHCMPHNQPGVGMIPVCSKSKGVCGQASPDLFPIDLIGNDTEYQAACDSSIGLSCPPSSDQGYHLCYPDVPNTESHQGLCMRICDWPDPEGNSNLTSCPERMVCSRAFTTLPDLFVPAAYGAQPISCQSPLDCAHHSGSSCIRFDTGQYCAYPAGLCATEGSEGVDGGVLPGDAGGDWGDGSTSPRNDGGMIVSADVWVTGEDASSAACFEGMFCTSSSDCMPCGLTCGPGDSCEQQVQCTDDSWEPNNSVGMATDYIAEAPITGGTLCSGDEDWFVVPAYENDTIAVNLEYMSLGGTPDAEIYKSTSPLLQSWVSAGGADPLLSFVYVAPEDDTYYIRLFSSGMAYYKTLGINIQPCLPNGEPNETFASAYDVGTVAVGSPIFFSGALCDGLSPDLDFFKMEGWMTDIYIFTISLTYDYLACGQELDLNLFDGDEMLHTANRGSSGFATVTSSGLYVYPPYFTVTKSLTGPPCPYSLTIDAAVP